MRHLTLLCLLALSAGRLAAQISDAGVLSVRKGGREVARETFGSTLCPDGGRSFSARQQGRAGGPDQVSVQIDLTPAAELYAFDYKSAETRVLGAVSGPRLTLRSASRGRETARELPAGPGLVVLDDRLVAPFAVVSELATPEGRPLVGIFPATGRRVSFVARAEQSDGRRVVTLTGDLAGTITAVSGRLTRVEIPALDLDAVRLIS